MSRLRIDLVVFLAGLAAVCWIGFGYVAGANLLALAVTLLIGACYLAGAFELWRYRQATSALDAALAELATPPAKLGLWLDRLPAGLRGAVRLRVESERTALPGPALTPYLVGLLVLLGMFGTLLGMVATLKGTGTALEGSTDLVAIRASLAAPVKGLAFAFGTSIAGVATSAMLGLLSALCRRERGEAAQRLDAKIETTLHVFSNAHRREAGYALMQRQAEAMPVLVDRLHTVMQTIEQQSLAMNERQIASQAAFLGKAEATWTALAASVARSLQDSAAGSARAASAAVLPAVEATLAKLEDEAAALHGAVTQAVERQLNTITSSLEASTATFKAETRALHETVAQAVERQLSTVTAGFDATTATLKDQTASLHETVTQSVERQLTGITSGLETTSAALSTQWHEALAQHRQLNETSAENLRASLDRYADAFEQRSAQLLDNVATRLGTSADAVAQTWNAALEHHSRVSGQLAEDHQQALAAAAAQYEQHTAALLRAADESHAGLETRLTAREAQRLDAWRESIAAMTATLRAQWDEALAQTASRQQAICETLEHTAGEVAASAAAHSRETIAEIARLVEAASEAPRAAADVIAELRQKLSDSMVHDTAMLEERNRLLATLETLLAAVNHASTEQRGAIDSLVTTSSDLLERVGARFTERVETGTGRLDGVAAQVASGATEVASLGDAFGAAVQSFGTSNETLVAQLQRIEAALDKSLARSDEQLAYYVTQAREVIDLSLLSQKQIMEELQQLAGQRTEAGADTA
ncbi:DUF802 domain-containing protein [Paraburkholderia acidipaludis]|uniref:DUF802 domain-containing protein n=1 Tax=Paraburkholderia acidipaludis TaxID=660537 RepID=UPI0004859E81|nr:DUF802 domain-containing protein [Paraburkholderia acidipaludis]